MKLTKDEYFALVSDLLSREEFDKKVSNYEQKYSGLLTEDAIAHLIIDELGRNVTTFSKIIDLRSGARATFFSIVTEPEPKIFTKKDGKLTGAEVFITDHTSRCRLVLWDAHHVDLVKDGKLKVDTKLKIINAKISRSSYGLDVTLDRFESLNIDPTDFPEPEEFKSEVSIKDISSIENEGPVNVLGTVVWKSQLRTFNRKDKSVGSVLNLDLFDGTGKIRITLWDSHAKTAENFDVGDQLKIINGYTKTHNSEREIHTNYRTQIVKENDD